MKFNGAMLRGLLVGSLALVMAGGVCVPGLAQSKSVAGLSSLPANAQAPVSAALGKDDSSYWARPSAEGFRAENARQALAADFTKQGTEVRSHNQRWVLETQAYGYGNVLHPLKAVAPQANANRVEYRRDGVTEWYANGPLGLEQGFTLTHRPGTANGQPLTLELGLSGDLVAALESAGSDKKSNALELRGKDGKAALHYTGLQARDASGRELRSWLELSGERLLVRVDDRAARYPVVIDPWVQLAELTASDGAAHVSFGYSIAVSGSTVVVGSPFSYGEYNPGQGAAYVFGPSGTGWTQQAELTPAGGGECFGTSVAVSGGTAVVGDSCSLAAYVFVQSGTDWSQTAELTSSDGSAGDNFGASVAVSGNTAVVGAIYHTVGSNGDQGAAYVFVQSGTDWSQTAELTSSDGAAGDNFGASVAVSGSTAVVGAPYHTVGSNAQQGAAYVFGLSPFTFSPTSLSFGNQTINTTSAPQTVTITNSGTSTVNISSISATEYFEVTATTCGSTLDVGASCTATVTFTPTLGGAITGTLVVNDNATGDPQAVGLSGTGVIVYAQVTITPSSLNFGNQAWGTISNPKSVTIKNVSTNNAVLYFSGFSLTGSGDFGISANTCGASLAVNKTCKVSLIYFPGLYGAELATLSIAGTVSGSPLTVAVSGTGVEDATLTPASHTFPRTKVGNTSTAHTFTLKNNLSTTLTGISYSTAAPFAVSASTCGTTLNSKTSCTISVTFSPTATGTTTGTLIVEDNSNSSTLIANLTGTGD